MNKHKKEPNQYLSEAEKEKVEQFCNDDIMCEAVRKVITEVIYLHGVNLKDEPADVLKNWALVEAVNFKGDKEKLGGVIAAKAEGLQMLEYGFMELLKVKSDKTLKGEGGEGEDNPAE